jgi:hypothetical protein
VTFLVDNWLRGRAADVLARRFGDTVTTEVLDDAFRRYRAEVASLAGERSAGGRLMVRCAALTAALHDALVETGLPAADARTRVAEVTAAIYAVIGRAPWLIARCRSRSPLVRLRRATSAFRTFPFGPPAYQMIDVPSDERTVAFDVVRCPVAEYFRERGLVELCVEAWCNLDYELAERWGGTLERATTLVEGAARCDFRWHVADPKPPS